MSVSARVDFGISAENQMKILTDAFSDVIATLTGEPEKYDVKIGCGPIEIKGIPVQTAHLSITRKAESDEFIINTFDTDGGFTPALDYGYARVTGIPKRIGFHVSSAPDVMKMARDYMNAWLQKPSAPKF